MSIQDVLDVASELEVDQLAVVVCADQQERWRRGEGIPAETYLDRYPALTSDPDQAVDIIYSEYVARVDSGERPEAEEFLRRFPRFEEQLRRQIDLDAGLEPSHGGGATREVSPPPDGMARFDVREPLGAGAFGRVWRALDGTLGREVALKILHPHLFSEEHQERFLREARAAAQLDHPNLITVHDCGVGPDGCHISYQLVRGRTLAETLQERSYSPHEAATMVRKLAEAVHHAHGKGVIHRDLKAENVLIDEDGEPHVSDFGLVRLKGEATLTMEGAILGTPAYMPPEQAEGGAHLADPRSDVYSLGVILYLLLTRRLPFEGAPQSVLRKVVEEEPPRPVRVNRDVPRDMETICLRAMAKSPGGRYGTAAALAEDLRRWLAGEPIRARPAGWGEKIVKWSRRKPAVAGLVAVSAVAILAVCVLVIVGVNRLRRQAMATSAARLAEKGVRRLEEGDTNGLLYLLKARKRAPEGSPEARSAQVLWSAWYAECRDRLLQVVGHDGPVDEVLWCSDGSGLVTVPRKGHASLWEADTGRWISDLDDGDRTHSCSVSADGSRVATSSVNPGDLCIWDASSGDRLAIISRGVRFRYPRFAPDSHLLVASASDGTLWRFNTGADPPQGRVFGETLGGEAVFAPDGSRVATLVARGDDRARWVQVYELDGRPRPSAEFFVGQGSDRLRFLPDGGRMVVSFGSGGDHTAKVYDVDAGGRCVLTLHHEEDVWGLAVSSDGQVIATGAYDSLAFLWDATTGERLRPPLLHDGPVLTLDFDADGSLLGSGSKDGAVRAWSTATKALACLPFRHNGWVEAVAMHPRVERIASASRDGTARIWTLPGGDSMVADLRHDERVWAAQFTPDGTQLATIDEAGTACLWEIPSEDLLWSSSKAGRELYDLVLSKDGRSLFFGGDVAPHRATPGLAGGEEEKLGSGGGRSLALSPDGHLLVAGDIGGGLRVFDLSGPEVTEKVIRAGEPDSPRGLHSLAYSPDEDTVVAVEDGVVEIWDPCKGRMVRDPLPIHSPVEVAAYRPDGDELAVASQDGTVQFWNARSWQPLDRSLQRTVHAMDLVYSSDGKILATIDARGIAQLWDPHWGLPAGEPMVHGGHGLSIALSPVGGWVATGTFAHSARVWSLPDLTDISVEMMTLRTRVALGADLGPYSAPAPIPWDEWQRDRKKLEESTP